MSVLLKTTYLHLASLNVLLEEDQVMREGHGSLFLRATLSVSGLRIKTHESPCRPA